MNRLTLIKYTGIAAAIVLVFACTQPWVFIESRNMTITGLATGGTNFGKPAYLHFILAGLFLVCTLIQRVGLKRLNLLVTALNLAWAIRNYFMIPACSGGECPVKKLGLYLMLGSSILMLIAAVFPDMKVPARKNS